MTKQAFIFLFLFLFMGVAWTGCYGCFGSSDDESTVVVDDDDGDDDDGDDDDGDDDDDDDGDDDDGDDGGDDDEAPESLADVLGKAGEAIDEVLGGEGGTVKEAVDFRKLKDLLPEKVDGLERTSAEGERTSIGFLGMQLSNAKGRYEDGDESMEISISDLGTLTGIAKIGYTAWLQTEIDRESDRGFERTRKFRSGGKEYPSFEKFEGTGDEGNCEIQVWVAERSIVSIEGRNVEMDQCEDARDEISFRQLDRMKDEGTED